MAVMLFSVLGYGIGGGGTSGNQITYNGIEFFEQGEFWLANIGGVNFIFQNNPEEILGISENLNGLENYYNKPLYIFSENLEAEGEIYKNLNPFAQRIQKACLDEDCGENYPIKTCSDNFVVIKESEISRIYQQENCVFIEGKSEDLIMLSDEFLFKILDVI